ncbi:hypothetical protein KKC17_02555 [Patescibacteria group bacterium]|nr:hypothetical protein [Patescibacteria group bacterium]
MRRSLAFFGSLYRWFTNNSTRQLFLAGGVSLLALAFLQLNPTLNDPDSFYHIGLTVWLRDYGLLNYFPWTQYSFYNQIFIDHHFGYHLLLIPFVSLWPGFWGIKIATLFFGSLTLFFLWWLLVRWRVPYWGWLVPVVLATSPFLFRLSLAKAPSLSVGLLLVAYYLISERKIGWLFLLSWFFVWVYSAWPLLIVLIVIEIIAGCLFGKLFLKKKITQIFKDNKYVLVLLSSLAGLVVGLIINPYFPRNFIYLKQLFAMALKPYHSFLAIGAEWYPFPVVDLIAAGTFIVGLWFLATLVAIINYKKISQQTMVTWLLSLLFLFYTLKARRQVEYLVPFMVLSVGFILKDGWIFLLKWLKNWRDFLPRPLTGQLFLFFLITYLGLALPLGLIIGYGRTYWSLRQGFTETNLLKSANWLKNNTPANSLVWQTDWGTFPLLWYYNSHNNYLTGLDQTFMYAFSPDLYEQWRQIVTGQRQDVYEVVKNNFKSDYVLLEKRIPAMLYSLNRDKRFSRVYQDEEVIIFSVN